MTTVTAARQLTSAEVSERLRVWRDRWRNAPDVSSRAHAQVAIDCLLDRRLELAVARLVIPVQVEPVPPDARVGV